MRSWLSDLFKGARGSAPKWNLRILDPKHLRYGRLPGHLFLLSLASLVFMGQMSQSFQTDHAIDISEPPYGATPNDSLNNSQTFVNAIATGARSIYIPGGPLYVMGTPGSPDINIPAGVTIFSDGPAAGGLRLAANSTKRGILRVSADSSVVIRDMQLDGTYATREDIDLDHGRVWGVLITPTNEINSITVQDCWIRDVSVGVFVVVGGTICRLSIEDNIFELQSRAYQNSLAKGAQFITTSAVYIANTTSCGIWIKDNYITGGFPDLAADSSSAAIYVNGPNAFVTDNWIVNWGHGGDLVDSLGVGIETGSEAKNFILSGNDISATYGPAYRLDGDQGEIRSGRADDIKRYPVVELLTNATNMVVAPSFRTTNHDSARVGGAGFPGGLDDGHMFTGSAKATAHAVVVDTLFYVYGGALTVVSP